MASPTCDFYDYSNEQDHIFAMEKTKQSRSRVKFEPVKKNLERSHIIGAVTAHERHSAKLVERVDND